MLRGAEFGEDYGGRGRGGRMLGVGRGRGRMGVKYKEQGVGPPYRGDQLGQPYARPSDEPPHRGDPDLGQPYARPSDEPHRGDLGQPYHRDQRRRDNEFVLLKRSEPISEKQKQQPSNVDTDSFARWLDTRRRQEAETTAPAVHAYEETKSGGVWESSTFKQEQLRRAPDGYVPPELARKLEREARQPWERRYGAVLAVAARKEPLMPSVGRFVDRSDLDVIERPPEQQQQHPTLPPPQEEEEEEEPLFKRHMVSHELQPIALPLDHQQQGNEEALLLPLLTSLDNDLKGGFLVVEDAGLEWLQSLFARGSRSSSTDAELRATLAALGCASSVDEEARDDALLKRGPHALVLLASESREPLTASLVEVTIGEGPPVLPVLSSDAHGATWLECGELLRFPRAGSVAMAVFELAALTTSSLTVKLEHLHYQAAAAPKKPTKDPFSRVLAASLLASWVAKEDCDVTLVCRGEEIKAHSIVLKARAPKMTTIDGFLPEAVRLFVAFCYTDDVPIALESAVLVSLLELARSFELPRLANIADLALCQQLTIETATELREATSALNAPRLAHAVEAMELGTELTPAAIAKIGSLSATLEKRLAASVDATNYIALAALSERFGSASIRAACLEYSLKDRAALKSADFRRIAANSSLGLDMLKSIAASKVAAAQ